MIARCHDPRNKHYRNYGERGITVCHRWRESIDAFLADIPPRPSSEHQLERLDNERGYEPGNVGWATRKEQNRNKRTTSFVVFRGENVAVGELAERFNIASDVLYHRIKRGWDVERAVTAPGSRPYDAAR